MTRRKTTHPDAINIRIPPTWRARVEAAAEQDECHVADWLRGQVRRGLDRWGAAFARPNPPRNFFRRRRDVARGAAVLVSLVAGLVGATKEAAAQGPETELDRFIAEQASLIDKAIAVLEHGYEHEACFRAAVQHQPSLRQSGTLSHSTIQVLRNPAATSRIRSLLEDLERHRAHWDSLKPVVALEVKTKADTAKVISLLGEISGIYEYDSWVVYFDLMVAEPACPLGKKGNR